MNAYLDGIKAKLNRADENIQNLKLEIASFLRDNYRISHQFNVESRQYIFTAYGESEVPPPFALLVGVRAVVQMADRLAITKSKTEMEIIGMSPPVPPGLKPTKDGAEIFRVFFGEKFDPDMEMKGNFAFQVAFDQNGPLKHGAVI